MCDQFGFDFGMESEPAFAELPAGAWLAPAFTAAEYRELFATAEAGLAQIEEPMRALFAQGIAASRCELAAMQRSADRGESAFQLWRARWEADPETLLACLRDVANPASGQERKCAQNIARQVNALYVPGVGSLLVRAWGADNIGVDYYPWRDAFFMQSYRDCMARVYAPVQLWGDKCAAMALAESGEGVAAVHPFEVAGRSYVNDGDRGCGDHRECEGWTFRPPADWRGPTYSYRTQLAAWDKGRTERGDRRGLTVRVRGQLCVLDGAALVYDDMARSHGP